MEKSVLELAFSLAEGKGPVHVVSIALDERQDYDVNAVAADAVHNNTSFLYSGRHDHGRLPSLKTSGHSARLLSAIGEAKRLSDEYITGLMAGGASSIGGDNAGGEGESDEESAAPKKARVEEGRC